MEKKGSADPPRRKQTRARLNRKKTFGIMRNASGYYDPTAGIAIRNILRENRKKTGTL